jgi:2-polyprenyl-3-methyl-5-hydroxy-6-metoxy-1,4-benzoquinol methylase
MMIKMANPAEVLTSSVNSLREQMRWRASLSRSWSSRLHEPWNHNLHYHRVIIDVIAPDCQRALDIGCGQGALTRRLRQLVPEVTGIDRDERSIALARSRAQVRFPDVGYVHAEFLAEPVKPGSSATGRIVPQTPGTGAQTLSSRRFPTSRRSAGRHP